MSDADWLREQIKTALIDRIGVPDEPLAAALADAALAAIEAADAGPTEIGRLRLEIEDWRGRLATQCGQTLAAIRRVEALEARLP